MEVSSHEKKKPSYKSVIVFRFAKHSHTHKTLINSHICLPTHTRTHTYTRTHTHTHKLQEENSALTYYIIFSWTSFNLKRVSNLNFLRPRPIQESAARGFLIQLNYEV